MAYLAEAFGKDFTPETKAAWRKLFDAVEAKLAKAVAKLEQDSSG